MIFKKKVLLVCLWGLLLCPVLAHADGAVQFATQEDEKAFDEVLKRQTGSVAAPQAAVKNGLPTQQFLRKAYENQAMPPAGGPAGPPGAGPGGLGSPGNGSLPPPPQRPNGAPPPGNAGGPPLGSPPSNGQPPR